MPSLFEPSTDLRSAYEQWIEQDVVLTICRTLEDMILHHVPFGDLYLGVQRASLFNQQIERYQALASRCRRIVVWCVADEPLPFIPHIQFVFIEPGDPLANEWFTVLDSPVFSLALLFRTASAARPGDAVQSLWFYKPEAMQDVLHVLETILKEPTPPPLHRDEEAHERSYALFGKRLAEQPYGAAAHALHDAAMERAGLVEHALAQLVLDTQGRIAEVSPVVADMFGQQRAALLGQPLMVLAEQAVSVHELRPVLTNSGSCPPKPRSHTALERETIVQRLGLAWHLVLDLHACPGKATANELVHVAHSIDLLANDMQMLDQLMSLLPHFEHQLAWRQLLEHDIANRVEYLHQQSQQLRKSWSESDISQIESL